MGTCCSSQHSEGTPTTVSPTNKPIDKYAHKDAPEKIPTVHASQRVFPPRGRAASESYIPSSVPIAAIRLIDEHGKQHTQVVLNPTALKHADELAQSQNGTNSNHHTINNTTTTTTNGNAAESKMNGDTNNNTTNHNNGVNTASSSSSSPTTTTTLPFNHTHIADDSSSPTAATTNNNNNNNNNSNQNNTSSSSSSDASSASRSSPEAVPTVGILFHESENSSSGSPILNSNAVNRLDTDLTSPLSDRRHVAETSFNAVSSSAAVSATLDLQLVDVALQEQSPAVTVPTTSTARPLTVSP